MMCTYVCICVISNVGVVNYTYVGKPCLYAYRVLVHRLGARPTVHVHSMFHTQVGESNSVLPWAGFSLKLVATSAQN